MSHHMSESTVELTDSRVLDRALAVLAIQAVTESPNSELNIQSLKHKKSSLLEERERENQKIAQKCSALTVSASVVSQVQGWHSLQYNPKPKPYEEWLIFYTQNIFYSKIFVLRNALFRIFSIEIYVLIELDLGHHRLSIGSPLYDRCCHIKTGNDS